MTPRFKFVMDMSHAQMIGFKIALAYMQACHDKDETFIELLSMRDDRQIFKYVNNFYFICYIKTVEYVGTCLVIRKTKWTSFTIFAVQHAVFILVITQNISLSKLPKKTVKLLDL